jgi:hypothetical protein
MRQNFDPTIWGPKAWFFLETITMAYPMNPSEEEKKNTKLFFYTLQFVIPCEKCRKNYNEHLDIYPLSDEVLNNRDNLFKWIVNMHNSVDINKKRSYNDTYNFYINKYSGSKYHSTNLINNKTKNIFIVLTLIFGIILFHKFYKYLKY